jgi:molybdopterin-guanine dinucleotide biosynthesis protein A
MKFSNVTGIVLAGGKSSRMGTDKALLLFRNKPLIQHAVDILKQVCSEVVISANHNNYHFTECEVWPDEHLEIGPMAGIYSCLKHSVTQWNMVLSCDMPLIEPNILISMFLSKEDYDVILPVHDNDWLEPLCAIYNRRLVSPLEEFIDSGNYSLWQFIRRSNHLRVEIPSHRKGMFDNVNTSQDFDLLNKR